MTIANTDEDVMRRFHQAIGHRGIWSVRQPKYTCRNGLPAKLVYQIDIRRRVDVQAVADMLWFGLGQRRRGAFTSRAAAWAEHKAKKAEKSAQSRETARERERERKRRAKARWAATRQAYRRRPEVRAHEAAYKKAHRKTQPGWREARRRQKARHRERLKAQKAAQAVANTQVGGNTLPMIQEAQNGA